MIEGNPRLSPPAIAFFVKSMLGNLKLQTVTCWHFSMFVEKHLLQLPTFAFTWRLFMIEKTNPNSTNVENIYYRFQLLPSREDDSWLRTWIQMWQMWKHISYNFLLLPSHENDSWLRRLLSYGYEMCPLWKNFHIPNEASKPHETETQNIQAMVMKCTYCEQTFRHSMKFKSHMIQIHRTSHEMCLLWTNL